MKLSKLDVASTPGGSSLDAALHGLDPVIRWILFGLRLLPPLERLPLPVSRALFQAGLLLGSPLLRPKGVQTARVVVGGDGPAIQTWQHRSWEPGAPGLLFIHGGGWVYGSCFSHRQFCALLAAHAGCKVYSVEYRRAPEHPFPAPLHDVHAAWEWLVGLRREQPGLHARGLMVGGDSAGGNLAAALCHRLRDTGRVLPDAQVLIYPVLDLGQNYESMRQYGRGFMLTSSLMRWLAEQYAGARAGRAAELSPIEADSFRELPPAFIALAGCDILLDQGRRYAEKLASAGVPVTLKIFDDMIHGFVNLLLSRGAQRATMEILDHVRRLCPGGARELGS